MCRAEDRFDNLQSPLVQRLGVGQVTLGPVELREGVVEVGYMERLGPGEPVGESQRATVAKLGLLPLCVILVRVGHHPQVLGNLGMVRPEHVLEPLQGSLVRSLRRGGPVELVAYFRQPHQSHDDGVHVSLLIPGSLSRLPHAHRVSGELPGHLEVTLVQLHLANLRHNLRHHRRLRAHQQLLRREGPSKGLLRLEMQPLPTQTPAQFEVHAHSREVRGVAFRLAQHPQHERSLAGLVTPREEIRHELAVHVRGEHAVR